MARRVVGGPSGLLAVLGNALLKKFGQESDPLEFVEFIMHDRRCDCRLKHCSFHE